MRGPGDLPAALAEADTALALIPAELPLERGKALVVKGQLERRARHKRAAREALRGAAAIFESVGAAAWVRNVRRELARTGIKRARGRELTATEARVAELAALGWTNRQMAEALFLSPKTVEANVARIYRKLGIRSRAELGRAVAATTRPGGDAEPGPTPPSP